MIFSFFFFRTKEVKRGRTRPYPVLQELPVRLPLWLIISLSIGCLHHLWDHWQAPTGSVWVASPTEAASPTIRSHLFVYEE